MAEINPKESKCWNCQFGLCVFETEQERIYHAGLKGGNLDCLQEDNFELFAEDEEPSELIEHVVEHERIKTICFYKPDGIPQSPPILVANIKDCNRFKQK